MSRHRGRSRPFTARRRIWPKHCGCSACNLPEDHARRLEVDLRAWGLALFDLHPVWTVAPPVLSVSKPSGLVEGDMLYMSGVPENVTPPEGWTRDGNGWRKVVRTVAPR